MRTLITGGAGFIGSHLCDYYLSKGHEVICVDNLLTGSSDNIAHLFENENFKFIKHNITEFIYIAGDIDNILHFASPASPVDFQKYPIQILKVGALGTYNVLGLAKAKKSKFLFASSSECYGDPQIHPQQEDYWGHVNPVGVRSVYDEAKRFGEAITMAYHRYHGIDTRIVRIFNTYGSRMRLDDGRVVPAFISQAFLDKDLTVFGNGSQTRSFCYVSDLVKGIDKLLSSNENYPVNIGNPNEITILEFAKKILALTNSKSQVAFHPLPADDPKRRQPDITRAKTILNWEPEIDLEQGLKITIDYFKNYYYNNMLDRMKIM